MTIAMIAVDSFAFSGREITKGERLELRPIEAAILHRQRKARFTTEQEDVEHQAVIEPAPEPPPVEATVAPARRRRRSRRRDIHPSVTK